MAQTVNSLPAMPETKDQSPSWEDPLDTHCIRICERFGMTPRGCKDPVKTEQVMVKLVAPEEQSDFCHRIVWFGREVCTARSPRCEECVLKELCAMGQAQGK